MMKKKLMKFMRTKISQKKGEQKKLIAKNKYWFELAQGMQPLLNINVKNKI